MIDSYELILSGKNIVLNAEGFLDYIRIDAEPLDKQLPLKDGISEISQSNSPDFLLATVYNGQPMLLRKVVEGSRKATDKVLQDFTRVSGTDALSLRLNEQLEFEYYSYYRAGQLLKSTINDKSGPEIPYEKLGTAPELVLTAFCDSWLVLQQLLWQSFKLQPSLEGA